VYQVRQRHRGVHVSRGSEDEADVVQVEVRHGAVSGFGEAAPIEVRGLVKRYGELTAVAGVDVTVRSGDVYGYLGPNGAGKTTSLRMMLGLIRPTAGTGRLGVNPAFLQALGVTIPAVGPIPVLVERVFVRTLRHQSVTTQTVGTVAAFGLILALISRIYGTAPLLEPSLTAIAYLFAAVRYRRIAEERGLEEAEADREEVVQAPADQEAGEQAQDRAKTCHADSTHRSRPD